MTQEIAVRQPSEAQVFRGQFEKMAPEIQMALPPQVPVERFMRVVLTAVNGNANLLKAERKSLFEASMKAAQDGLLPDGRDGALVTFGNKVQWMPMIGGVLKKVRNSGELLSIAAHVVHEKDSFTYILGDDEKIEHSPLLAGDRGKPIAVYAIAKTKDGGIYREVMSLSEIERVRAVSRAKDSGPWKDWWSEMARKTVLRRLSKRLPMSTDLDDLIRRDDELYELDGKNGTMAGAHTALFQPVANPLSDDEPEIEIPGNGAEDGAAAATPSPEVAAAPNPSDDDFPGDRPSAAEPEQVTPAQAFKMGAAAAERGLPADAFPAAYTGQEKLIEAYRKGHASVKGAKA